MNPGFVMGMLQTVSALAIKGMAQGVVEIVGLHAVSKSAEAVADALFKHFTDHSHKLGKALKIANERAWQALEISLEGDSWWEQKGNPVRPPLRHQGRLASARLVAREAC